MTHLAVQYTSSSILWSSGYLPLIADVELDRICLVGWHVQPNGVRQGKIVIYEGTTGRLLHEIAIGRHFISVVFNRHLHCIYILDDQLLLDERGETIEQEKPGQIIQITIATGQIEKVLTTGHRFSLLYYSEMRRRLYVTYTDSVQNQWFMGIVDEQLVALQGVFHFPQGFVIGLDMLSIPETNTLLLICSQLIIAIDQHDTITLLPGHGELSYAVGRFKGRFQEKLYFMAPNDDMLLSFSLVTSQISPVIALSDLTFDTIDPERGIVYLHAKNASTSALFTLSLSDDASSPLQFVGYLPAIFTTFNVWFLIQDVPRQRLFYVGNEAIISSSSGSDPKTLQCFVLDFPDFVANTSQGLITVPLNTLINDAVFIQDKTLLFTESGDSENLQIVIYRVI